jgi:hypothetical protein
MEAMSGGVFRDRTGVRPHALQIDVTDRRLDPAGIDDLH